MKTAISVPDETFARAERAAKELNVTRSELYSRAVARYVDELEKSSLTPRIDAALERLGGEDDGELERAVTEAGRRLVASDGDDAW